MQIFFLCDTQLETLCYFCSITRSSVKKKNTTVLYFFLVLLGALFLIFEDFIFEEKQLAPKLIAVILLMFGMYKMLAKQGSNVSKEYDGQEHFTGEKYWEEEEE